MRRTALSLLVLASVGAACARTPVPHPARPSPDALNLGALAASLDDRSAAPLAPLLPADLRAIVAGRIPAGLAPADRLRIGVKWLETVHAKEACEGGDPHEPFLAFVTGWAIVEELAWSAASEQRLEAAAALYDRLREDPFWPDQEPQLRMLAKVGGQVFGDQAKYDRSVDRALCRGPVMRLIFSHAAALRGHFAAEILRGAPSDGVARVLRDEAARLTEAREFRRALPLAAAAARQLPGASDAWLELAKTSYRTDDVPRGDEALLRALTLGAQKESQAVKEAARFQVLAHQTGGAAPNGFEPSLARFWALFEMDREGEARVLVDRLRRERPKDARALVGDLWLKYIEACRAGEQLTVAHTTVLTLREARDLTNRDARYYRFYLALAVQEASIAWTPALGENRDPATDPQTLAAIGNARRLCKEFAAYLPDEVATYGLIVDFTEMIVRRANQARDGSDSDVEPLFSRAREVYAAHPSPDSYRLLLGLAVWIDDKEAAYAAITAPLRFDATDDQEVWLLRARAYLSVAFRAMDWGRLRAVSTLVAEAPRSSDEINNRLQVVQSDVSALRALQGERDLWWTAARAYAGLHGGVDPVDDGDRSANNLLAIWDLLRPGGLFENYWWELAQRADPPWPVLVNVAASAFRAGHRDQAVAILRSRQLEAGHRLPAYADEWLACLEGRSPRPPSPPPGPETPPPFIVAISGEDRTSAGDEPGIFKLSVGLTWPAPKTYLSFHVTYLPWLVVSPRSCWDAAPAPAASAPPK